MSEHQEFEIDRILKLINEYILKIRDLLQLYETQKRRRMTILIFAGFFFIIIYSAIMIFSQYDLKIDVILYSGIGVVFIMILTIFFMLNFLRDSRNRKDILDELSLLRRQLSKLVTIASQAREHLPNKEYVLIEIDLKLTEAEEIISRIHRLPFFRDDLTELKLTNDKLNKQT